MTQQCSWQEVIVPDGMKYYYNAATHMTQWNKPQELIDYEHMLFTRPGFVPFVIQNNQQQTMTSSSSSSEKEEELIERFTENGEPTGEAIPRSQIHAQGIWHNTIAVWVVVNSSEKIKSGQMLIQKRSANKDSHPNKWDASCAGHISFGQTPLEAAVRELEEELGLTASSEQLTYLMRTKIQVVLNNGSFIDNEWMDVYLLEIEDDLDLSTLRLQEEEVSDVALIHHSLLKELYEQRDERLVCCVNSDDSKVLWSKIAQKFPTTNEDGWSPSLPVNFV